MSRSNITTAQKEVLQQMWDNGMTSTKKKDLVEKAVEETDLCQKTIKNWIGNTKQKLGISVKREPREDNKRIRFSGNARKRSAYTMFKKEFLASDKAKKLREEGVPDSQIQVRGNLEYRQLSPNTKEQYSNAALEINTALPEILGVSKNNMVLKLVKNIQTNMKQLDQLGCPSLWLGFNGKMPQRFYSPEFVDLGEDAVFTNYVTSAIANKRARLQMRKSCGAQESIRKGSKPKGKKGGKSETVTRPGQTVGDVVSLLDDNGQKVGDGQVTDQTAVHGLELKEGWTPLLVLDGVVDVTPHDDYPNPFSPWQQKNVARNENV